MVNGHGESRLMVVGVVLDHLGKLQLPDEGLRHGHADQALAVGGHKVDVFRGGKLGGADEVALVFPVRIVRHQNEPALLQILQGFGNGVEFHNRPPC